MSEIEILAELPRLSAEELAEVQAKLDELAGEAWQDRGELSDAQRSQLDAALAAYQNIPAAGSPWADVTARVQPKLRPSFLLRMNARVTVRPEAEADITDAAIWYHR